MGEITSFMSKGIPPKYVERENENTVRVLNQKCNRNFEINYEESRLHDCSKKKVPDDKMLRPGDVLINSTGTGTAGRVAQLYDVPTSTTIDGHMILLRPTEEIDSIYYGYAVKAFQSQIETLAEGSTGQTEINRKRLQEEIVISFPKEKETQDRIAHFLLNIDEKIKVNNKINKNLEQQAQAIFDDMFPDLFSLNTDATLQDLIVFANGKKRPKTIGNIPVYGGNGILAYTDKSNADNCVIIGRVGAYCGNTFLCLDKCWTSDNAIQAKSRTGSSPLFIYYLLRNASLSSRHIGTGQPLMTQGILNAIPIKYPVEEKISAFIETCSPIHKMISGNRQQNESLASIRDSMLPKLMSGEMDVSELNL